MHVVVCGWEGWWLSGGGSLGPWVEFLAPAGFLLSSISPHTTEHAFMI